MFQSLKRRMDKEEIGASVTALASVLVDSQNPARTLAKPNGEQPAPVTAGSNEEPPETNSARFAPFPNLPTEIRLKIFRSMFPRGRHVCLDADFPWTFNYESPVLCQNRRRLPPTLYINQESRYETLQHYHVIFKSDSAAFKGYKPFTDRPFCFNPSIDSVYITFGSLHGGTNYRRFDAWMEYLNTQLPGGTNSIQSLEVRDVIWAAAPIKDWIHGQSPLPTLAKWNKSGGLEWFHGLKELCFTYYRDADNGFRYNRNIQYLMHHQQMTQRVLDEYAAGVTNWYIDFTERAGSGTIPHVTARTHHKVKWSAFNIT